MTDDVKFCVNCKHFVKTAHSLGGCAHPEVQVGSVAYLVTGDVNSLPICIAARIHPCGQDGKLWTAKEAT